LDLKWYDIYVDICHIPVYMCVYRALYGRAWVLKFTSSNFWIELCREWTVYCLYIVRVFTFFPGEIAKAFQKALSKQGFKFSLGTKVTGAETSGSGVKLSVEDKKGKKSTLNADVVLVAIGRSPYTEGLGLEDVGVAMDGRQVAVNDALQTSVPSIYAIGDAVKGPMLAHKAEEEGIYSLIHI